MSTQGRERVKQLLDEAAKLPASERADFVRRAARDDPAAAAEALGLLEVLDDSRFLNAPTVAADPAATRGTGGVDAEPSPPPGESPGGRIGRYKLLQQIGEGGFGTVFMAEQTEPVSRHVALKIVKAGMDTRQVVARFEAERQALALMDHPNIARVFDGGATEAGRPYFVMELVRGEPITKYCDREQLSIEQRLKLFRDVCHAVQHAHQKGIIHRDLKPSNVLVTVADSEPAPKVIDFGVAKSIAARLTDRTMFTQMNQLIGTPEYMSPEQADPASADIDTRSDVYSLGTLLYELLTGMTPFDGASLLRSGWEGMIRTIREVQPPRPSQRLSASRRVEPPASGAVAAPPAPPADSSHGFALPASRPDRGSSVHEIARCRRAQPQTLQRRLRGDLDAIVMKCLEKDRRRRYESPGALAEDIGRYLAHAPIAAKHDSFGYVLRRQLRRHWIPAVVASAFVLTLAGGLVASLWQWRRAEAALIEKEDQRRTADALRGLADRRADETQRVAEFQARMLSSIDAEALGRGIHAQFREQLRAALEKRTAGDAGRPRPLTSAEIDAEMQAFEQRTAPARAADVARQVLHAHVLKPALQALPGQLGDQPQAQAHLLHAIGTAYSALGAYDEALPALRAALVERRRHFGQRHVLVAETLNELANALQEKGDYAAAEPLYRDALEMRRELLGGEHADVAQTLSNLGELLRAAGHADAAEPLQREAVAICRRLAGDDHPRLPRMFANLAVTLHTRGGDEQAVAAYREALALGRAAAAADPRELAHMAVSLAGVLNELGRHAEAEALLREALPLLRARLGDNHSDVAHCLNNLAYTLHQQARFDQAEALYREALALRRSLFGEEHPDVARSLNNLGVVLSDQAKYDEAEPVQRAALALRRRVLGDEHPDVASNLNNLAILAQRRGDLAAAEDLYRESLALRRRALGDEHPSVAGALANLALVLDERGNHDEAEALLRESLALRRRLAGPAHPEVATTLNNLANVLAHRGDLPSAESLYREALELTRTIRGDRHPQVAMALCNLASLLVKRSQHEAAEPLFREALAIEQATYTSDHPATAQSHMQLAGVQLRIGRLDDAERNAAEAVRMCDGLFRGDHQLKAAALSTLALVHHHAGRSREARETITRASEMMLRVHPPEHRLNQSLRERHATIFADPPATAPGDPPASAAGDAPATTAPANAPGTTAP